MSKKEIYEEMGLKIKEHQAEIKKLAAARWVLREEAEPITPAFSPPGGLEPVFFPSHPFDEPSASATPPSPSKNVRVKCTDRLNWDDLPGLVRKTPGLTPEEMVKIKYPEARGGNKRGFIYKCNIALWTFQNRKGVMRSEVRYGKDGRRKHYYPVDPVGLPLQFDFQNGQQPQLPS
jgi:hypothetical protein